MTDTCINFFVEGTPAGQPRPRFAGGRTYTPSGPHEPWKERIAWFAKKHRPPEPFSGPISVDVCFVFERPKKHFTKKGMRPTAPSFHTNKPDRDNLDKPLLDVLTKAGFWKDDCQVCAGSIRKVYGHVPGADIWIRQL